MASLRFVEGGFFFGGPRWVRLLGDENLFAPEREVFS